MGKAEVRFTDPYEHLLPIYAERLSAADWDAIKRAKVSLGLDYLVKPQRAVPGSPGPILAIGVRPNWICLDGYAYISSTESPGLREALRCVITHADSPHMVTGLQMLQQVLGPGVREVEE